MSGSALEAAVLHALHRVHDPCSVNVGAAMSIIDMGLVTALDVTDDGAVSLTVRTTSPMCTLVGSIVQGAEDSILAVDGVTSVSTTVDTDMTWSEASMTAAGRRFLGSRRRQSRVAVPIARRAWANDSVAAARRN